MKKKVKKVPKYAAGGIAQASNAILMNTFGIDNNSKEGVMLNSTAQGADIGGSIVPGWGHLIGGAAGALMGSFKSGSVDPNTGEITYGGIFGRSSASLRRESNRIKNGIIADAATQNIKANYYNGFAEGGVMRRPVDALVSKGELIYDPTTKKLRQVPGSKGKPNKADDVYAKLYEGDVVISNSPTMLMANGKTPAQNLMGMVDKYATGGTVKAREAIIKKVVNWQEANKTKHQEYAMYSEGEKSVTPYGYNKNLDEFEYWDKNKKEYNKKYLDWVNSLTEQDVRDIEAGKYGDMTEYFSKNKGKKLDVATAQKLMTDKKYGNWHEIGKNFVDTKRANAKPMLPNLYDIGERHYLRGTLDKPVARLADTASVTPVTLSKTKITTPSVATIPIKESSKLNWLDEMSNLLPVIGGLFDKYDWHTESSQITPPRFVPVNADPRPLLRAADESLAMARYNQANISPNTGAGIAYGLQAASNRAKAYADAYAWQQDTQNKLIAQNAGIYNDWRKQRDAYATQAIADTRANEGATQQMRDQARKDRLEFYYGKRNDDMLAALLKPMFEYGTPDEAYRQIYKRRIV